MAQGQHISELGLPVLIKENSPKFILYFAHYQLFSNFHSQSWTKHKASECLIHSRQYYALQSSQKQRACLWEVSKLTREITKGSTNKQTKWQNSSNNKFSNSCSFFPLQTQISVLALPLHSFFNHCGLAFTSFASPTWLCQRKPGISRPSAASLGFTSIDLPLSPRLSPPYNFFSLLSFYGSALSPDPLTWQRKQYLYVLHQPTHRNNKTVYINHVCIQKNCGFCGYLISLLNTLFFNFSQVFNVYNFFFASNEDFHLQSSILTSFLCFMSYCIGKPLENNFKTMGDIFYLEWVCLLFHILLLI